MKSALAHWETLSTGERSYDGDLDAESDSIRRLEEWYPEGGATLRVHARDLPRPKAQSQPKGRPRPDWRSQAWNSDNVWLTKSETEQLVPSPRTVGTTTSVPRDLVVRLARLNLVDNVRGQTRSYSPEHVELAELTATIVESPNDHLAIEFSGNIHLSETGSWNQGRGETEDDTKRGFRGTLLGRGQYDPKQNRLVELELVSIGERWGGTRYNARGGDLTPHPIGFAFTLLAEDDPRARIAPTAIWHYHWKPPWK